jgi:hypothetical protein
VVKKKNRPFPSITWGDNEHHEPTKRLVERDGQSILSQALDVAPIAHNALKEHSDVEE